MSIRRVEACDSWRPPLFRAGPRVPPAFASLSVREGGGAAAVAKAVEEAVSVRAGERKGERREEGGVEATTKTKGRGLPPAALLVRHPLAMLALVPHSAALFVAGAAAGAVAKSVTAPLDRVKILMQVGALSSALVGLFLARRPPAAVWLTELFVVMFVCVDAQRAGGRRERQERGWISGGTDAMDQFPSLDWISLQCCVFRKCTFTAMLCFTFHLH